MVDMFEWLIALPLWFQIPFSIILVACILFVIVSIIRKGLTISRDNQGRIGLLLGSHKEPLKSPHATCPHSKDISILLGEIIKLSNEKFNLIEKTKIKLQMNYAAQKCDQLRSYMAKIYMELIATKTKEIIGNQSVIIYRLILKEIQNGVLGFFRVSFHEDSFDTMSERDFNNYIEDKFDYFISQVNEQLDNNYFYENDVKRLELHEINGKSENKVREMFEDIYSHARLVALDINVKALEYDERIQQLIQKYLG